VICICSHILVCRSAMPVEWDVGRHMSGCYKRGRGGDKRCFFGFIWRVEVLLKTDSGYPRDAGVSVLSRFLVFGLLCSRTASTSITADGKPWESTHLFLYVPFIGLSLIKSRLTIINRTRLWTKCQSAVYPRCARRLGCGLGTGKLLVYIR